jgi:hypothetical protein
MSLRITEYGGPASGTFNGLGLIQSRVVTVGSSVSTSLLSANTRLVEIDTDGGVFIGFGSSLSTAPALTGSSDSTASGGSTGAGGFAQRIPANLAPMPFYVNPFMKIFAVST